MHFLYTPTMRSNMGAHLKRLIFPVYIPMFLLSVGISAPVAGFPQYLGGLGASLTLIGVVVTLQGVGNLISDLPGGMGSNAKISWLIAGGGLELWKGYRHSQGLHGILCGLIGSELFANSHKRVQSLADLKGYRYRTAGL